MYDSNFKATICDDYFSLTEREIDWDDEKDSSKISLKQAEDLQKILTTEVSIFLLRRTAGFCESITDSMLDIRSDLIKNYENNYEKYISYNDFI